MTEIKNLKLYYKPVCPYCIKVMRFMAENQLKVTMCDIREEAHLNDLIEIGGKQQVPCLVNGDKPLYESLDIIDYLKNNYL